MDRLALAQDAAGAAEGSDRAITQGHFRVGNPRSDSHGRQARILCGTVTGADQGASRGDRAQVPGGRLPPHRISGASTGAFHPRLQEQALPDDHYFACRDAHYPKRRSHSGCDASGWLEGLRLQRTNPNGHYCIRDYCIRDYCIRDYCIRDYCIRDYCIRDYCIRHYWSTYLRHVRSEYSSVDRDLSPATSHRTWLWAAQGASSIIDPSMPAEG